MAGFFDKIKNAMGKTKNNIAYALNNLLSISPLDDEFIDELEECLILADAGVTTAQQLGAELKEQIINRGIKKPDEAIAALKSIIVSRLTAKEIEETYPAVILIVGVNGAGKTTAIGKLAALYKRAGKSVILCAADTFRAAAAEQLQEWGKRSDVPVIRHNEGADPAAVVYDAIHSAKAKSADVLIVDTAGRLHNKKNLMNELAKIGRVIEREYPGAKRSTLLVIDATTGRNGVAQAEVFNEAVKVDGVILTKLDGTAKGGVVLSIAAETGVPVRYVGVGEGIDDLAGFDAAAFADALFER
ncbi:MAG: signal recognition particle-docking protein FtsY [Christensenellales bacterium]|jgi:fused signal recognition particle receptor